MSYFLFTRGRTSQRIANDCIIAWWEQKLLVRHKPYILLKLETRLEIELSVERVELKL